MVLNCILFVWSLIETVCTCLLGRSLLHFSGSYPYSWLILPPVKQHHKPQGQRSLQKGTLLTSHLSQALRQYLIYLKKNKKGKRERSIAAGLEKRKHRDVFRHSEKKKKKHAMVCQLLKELFFKNVHFLGKC